MNKIARALDTAPKGVVLQDQKIVSPAVPAHSSAAINDYNAKTIMQHRGKKNFKAIAEQIVKAEQLRRSVLVEMTVGRKSEPNPRRVLGICPNCDNRVRACDRHEVCMHCARVYCARCHEVHAQVIKAVSLGIFRAKYKVANIEYVLQYVKALPEEKHYDNFASMLLDASEFDDPGEEPPLAPVPMPDMPNPFERIAEEETPISDEEFKTALFEYALVVQGRNGGQDIFPELSNIATFLSKTLPCSDPRVDFASKLNDVLIDVQRMIADSRKA